VNDKKKNPELLIKINWSGSRDTVEDRPFDESAKGLGSEMLWAVGLLALLSVIVILFWLVR
jgi:hypothetical protein